jgi:hypothetical protein
MKDKNIPYIITQEELDSHQKWLDNIKKRDELQLKIYNEILEEALIKSILNDLELGVSIPKRIILEKILETKDPDIKTLLWLQYEQLNNEKNY